MPQVPSKPSCFKTPWLLLSAVGCQPTAPKCLKFPPNPRASRPWLLLSAVGCQPTAPKCLQMPQVPSKPSCFKTMVAFKCCRLPTYSPNRLPTYSPKCLKFPPNPGVSRPWLLLSAVGCQPTAPKCINKPSCFKTPWLLLSAVGCQPTAPKCLKFPPNPGVSRPWLLLSAVGCQPTAPKCLKFPPNPRVSRPHGCF